MKFTLRYLIIFNKKEIINSLTNLLLRGALFLVSLMKVDMF